MVEEKKESTKSEEKKEKVLAEVSECGQCRAKRLAEERRCGHHIKSHCCEEEHHDCGCDNHPRKDCHEHHDCGCDDHFGRHNNWGSHNNRSYEGKRHKSYVY